MLRLTSMLQFRADTFSSRTPQYERLEAHGERDCKALTLCGEVDCQQSGQHLAKVLTSVQPLWFKPLEGKGREGNGLDQKTQNTSVNTSQTPSDAEEEEVTMRRSSTDGTDLSRKACQVDSTNNRDTRAHN